MKSSLLHIQRDANTEPQNRIIMIRAFSFLRQLPVRRTLNARYPTLYNVYGHR